MATSDAGEDVLDQWNRLIERLNGTMATSVEQNIEAQTKFVESWAEAMEQSMPEEEVLAEGFEGYHRAYEVWMDAADEMFDRTADAAAGEDVSLQEFRDIWLRTANEAFKEVMSTSAFAAATGDVVEMMMELQEESKAVSQETVAQLGLPTRDEVDEVATRLVALERRQHSVEQKLDQILEQLE